MDPQPADDAVPSDRWHGRPPEEWRVRWGVPELRIYTAVSSTNDIARTLAEAGAAHGTTVLADVQTRGRGRRGRAWHSAPGQSLLLSMVLSPPGDTTAVLPLRVGLAVARAIEACAPVAVRVKWPNDLLVGSRKLGGILCEAATEGRAASWIVAGIGINVLQETESWPPPLRDVATSMAAAGGAAVDMATLAGEVIGGVSMLPEDAVLRPEERTELQERDALRGRAIAVDGVPAGRAAGIEPDGALVVDADGRSRRITAGTVRLIGDEARDEEER